MKDILMWFIWEINWFSFMMQQRIGLNYIVFFSAILAKLPKMCLQYEILRFVMACFNFYFVPIIIAFERSIDKEN